MFRILQAMVTGLVFLFLLNAMGCTTQPTGNNQPVSNAPANQSATTTTTTTTINASPTPSPAPVTKAAANAAPLTLPVLDAFFADETFATELKTKLQLTDEQINKLRAVAREDTSKLRETSMDQSYSGTTAAARERAQEQVKTIIGEEKTAQLSALVRERWSSGGAEESGTAKDQGQQAGKTTTETTGAKETGNAKAFNAVPGDTRIVVNAPAYRMDVFENGKLTKSYKVGIGYPEFPLPTGLRKARQIIFNPTWTPPDSPWVETSNHVKPGQQIEAGSKLNPLGLLKIPIGLPSLIHGGKSPAKIGGFASHGCVGLTDSQVRDFAKVLAQTSGTELTDEEINTYGKNRSETKTVNLKNPIPVELRYETIVVEDGKLHIYRDVYDHGTNTEENLKAVLESYGVTLDQLSEQERTKIMDALQEMSRDASGKLDQPATGASKNAASNKDKSKRGAASDGKVTRTIKGRKEIVIEIAALQGKGYPAPVGMDSGGSKKTAAPSTGTRKRQ